MPEHWLNFVYQYIIGGLFFFSIIAMAISTGALKLRSREGRNTFSMLLLGFVLFFLVHGIWTYLIIGI